MLALGLQELKRAVTDQGDAGELPELVPLSVPLRRALQDVFEARIVGREPTSMHTMCSALSVAGSMGGPHLKRSSTGPHSSSNTD